MRGVHGHALRGRMTEAPEAVSKPRRRISPGCLMLVMGGLWMAIWGSWMVISMVRQVQELRTITDKEARLVTPRAASAVEIEGLRGRMREFGAGVAAKRAAVLELTVDDLNTLLAAEPQGMAMREFAGVEAITAAAIRFRVSLAMNGMPMSGERLYLNGFSEVKPMRHPEKGVILETVAVEVPGRELSPGFRAHYVQANHLDTLLMSGLRETTDKSVLEVLKQVTVVRLEAGKVVLDYAPAVR